MPPVKESDIWVCRGPKMLAPEMQVKAAQYALQVNPNNAAPRELMALVMPYMMALHGVSNAAAEKFLHEVLKPKMLAVITNRFWGSGGVKLKVAFMEPTHPDLQKKILHYANDWSNYCNVSFVLVASVSSADLRISRGPGGYYSYLGTDNRLISKGEQTMNLEKFVLATPDREYKRVVKHEFWHALGGPHEHQRAEIVQGIDRQKAIAWAERELGWDEQTAVDQILTPLSERELTGSPHAEKISIMSYPLPGSIMKDGKDVPGGNDLSEQDKITADKIYPLPQPPVKPPDPNGGGEPIVNPPNPTEGKKVDKETVRGWFQYVDQIMTGVATWLFLIPGISWVTPWVKDIATLFRESAKDEEILDAWVNMLSRGGLKLKTLTKTPKADQLKALKVSRAEKLKALKAAKAA